MGLVKHTPGGPPCPGCGELLVDHEVQMQARMGGPGGFSHDWFCHNPHCSRDLVEGL